MSDKTLAEYVQQIKDQIDTDAQSLTGTHSHNIIGAVLRIIEKKHGRAAAIEAMRECDLEEFGWTIPND